jgi:hypothetical protein
METLILMVLDVGNGVFYCVFVLDINDRKSGTLGDDKKLV